MDKNGIKIQDVGNDFIGGQLRKAVIGVGKVGKFDMDHSSSSSALEAFESVSKDLYELCIKWKLVLDRDTLRRSSAFKALRDADKQASRHFKR